VAVLRGGPQVRQIVLVVSLVGASYRGDGRRREVVRVRGRGVVLESDEVDS